MKIHELKCWSEPFDAIWVGRKTFEIRKNDRNFQLGDVLHLREWDKTTGYSGRECLAEVRYITESWGLPSDICVMAIFVSSKHICEKEPV